MADPTRPLPSLIPQLDGSWTGRTMLTPTSFTTRGRFSLPSSKVVPVIIVPGIMGSNLRAATSPRKRANQIVNPGDEVWRAPNGTVEGLQVARKWRSLDPSTRQKLLDHETVEVDRRGDIKLPLESRQYGMTEAEVRERYWGEVHWDSYGTLLYELHVRLNHTFEMNPLDNARVVCHHWKTVMKSDPRNWGVRSIETLTEKELEKHAQYHYPVYACGYNWLESCAESAKLLQQRIERIIAFWTERKRTCTRVILVTHSMGGLVARACAKEIPDRILGIIHGVMPALGAPVCYRRIACGTERWSPSNDFIDNKKAGLVADILGDQPDRTMAVMASSPGALELLPNHLYPIPWLHIAITRQVNHKDVGRDIVNLPVGNPYDLYRNMRPWYRLVDPDLADPVKKYRGDRSLIERVISTTVDTAEHFHRTVLDTYYHPNSYVIYGADPEQMSFGKVHWIARDPGTDAVFTEGNLREASATGYGPKGMRQVRVECRTNLSFVPSRQDMPGDGTVPAQSGAAPAGKVRQTFEMRGFDHQGMFNHMPTLLLTQHLIAKLTQKLP